MKKLVCLALVLVLVLVFGGFAFAEEENASLPSLKETYAGKFDFGTCLPGSAFSNVKLLTLVKEQFSILTPENELKPDSVLDVAASKELVEEEEDETAVAVHFDAARPLLRFAQSQGLKVHGHVLIWHSQTPEAFFHEGYDIKKPMVDRETMLGRMENYIKEVLTQTEELYPGVIVSWDVVNEAIDDGTNWLRKGSNWYKTVGEDFVVKAFEFARKYAKEGVLLYYNDYNTAYTGKLYGIINDRRIRIPDASHDGTAQHGADHHGGGEDRGDGAEAAGERAGRGRIEEQRDEPQRSGEEIRGDDGSDAAVCGPDGGRPGLGLTGQHELETGQLSAAV